MSLGSCRDRVNNVMGGLGTSEERTPCCGNVSGALRDRAGWDDKWSGISWKEDPHAIPVIVRTYFVHIRVH